MVQENSKLWKVSEMCIVVVERFKTGSKER